MSMRLLIRGFLLAHNAPKEILDALDSLDRTVTISDKILPEDLVEWELSVRTRNILENANIYTKTQLLSLSEGEVLKIPNCGRKSLNELKYYIKPHSFAFPAIVKLVPNDGWWVFPSGSKWDVS